MTDNTPRPEPMSREQVLSAIDSAASLHEENDLSDQGLRAVSAAVAALYERCEALERAVERKNSHLGALRDFMRDAIPLLDDSVGFTGTEPIDAEGGG